MLMLVKPYTCSTLQVNFVNHESAKLPKGSRSPRKTHSLALKQCKRELMTDRDACERRRAAALTLLAGAGVSSRYGEGCL